MERIAIRYRINGRWTVWMWALCVVLWAACSKSSDTPEADRPYQLEPNLILGRQLFMEAMGTRNSPLRFDILGIRRMNDSLELRVRGGGNAEAFQFIWDGRIQESHPMGIRLVLVYQGGDDFDSDRELTVSVNLRKIIGQRENVELYHFYVINGSAIETVTLNPDGSVTEEVR